MSAPKKGRLGRGLGALLSEYLPPEGAPGAAAAGVLVVAVDSIVANPKQPRRVFVPEQLAELQRSIQENGLLQPLVERPLPDAAADGPQWELVAGERRWRAVQALGWSEVPVLVRELDERAMLVLAIVENVQRANLSPLEEAMGYRQLIEEFGYTQQEVADGVGRDRSTVANLLRLLQLPESVQQMVDGGELAVGHARALLGLDDERAIRALAREVAEQGLSVRQVEQRVRQRRDGDEADASAAPAEIAASALDGGDGADLAAMERELARLLGARVRVRRGTAGDGRGRIEIRFADAAELGRIAERLLGAPAAL